MTELETFAQHPNVVLGRESAASIVENAEKLPVGDDIQAATAIDTVNKISTLTKAIETVRKDLTKPLDAAKKSLMEASKAICDPLNVAKGHLAERIETYMIAKAESEEALKQAEIRTQRASLRERNAGEIENVKLQLAELFGHNSQGELTPQEWMLRSQKSVELQKRLYDLGDDSTPTIPSDRTKAGGVRVVSATGSSSVSKQYGYTIESLADVPREYLMIDHDKVTEAIRSGVRQIPGLKIEEKYSASIRTAASA